MNIKTTHPALTGSLNTPSLTVINFSPGPTSLPQSVEERIAASFHLTKLTSLALSHRSPEFIDILKHAAETTRKVMKIPDDYEILFTHGGGHGQFAAVPLNLCHDSSEVATYVISGTWSLRAANEAKKYCQVKMIDASGNQTEHIEADSIATFPTLNEANIDSNSKFVYLCSNETVNGVELHRLPRLPESRQHIPLIVDASSDFSTKPIDWHGSNVGVLFACASKNIGHPGVTMTIVRKDLLGMHRASPICPDVFNYTINSEAGNLWNTPATFNIEVVGFLMDWLAETGGIHNNEQRCIAKAKRLYEVIDHSNGFYDTPVKDAALRSRMNVPFNVKGGDEALTNQFLIETWTAGMVGLRTLTPFGAGDYLRASLYNGITEADVTTLADFMQRFAKENA